jgi:hypothetical protein
VLRVEACAGLLLAGRARWRADQNQNETRTPAYPRLKTMPSALESSLASTANGSSTNATLDEIAQLKRQLLQAEIRLAKARATAAGAEADAKVLNARLRAITR